MKKIILNSILISVNIVLVIIYIAFTLFIELELKNFIKAPSFNTEARFDTSIRLRTFYNHYFFSKTPSPLPSSF